MNNADRRRRTVVLLGLAVGVVLLFVEAGQNPRNLGLQPPPSARVVEATVPAVSTVITEAPASASLTTVAPACLGQALKAMIGGQAGTQCVGQSTRLQSGSLLSYRFEATDTTGRWLNIDVAGREVMSASIGHAMSTEYACQPCTGIEVSLPDLQGVRTVSLQDLTLGAEQQAGVASGQAVLKGVLRTSAENISPASNACVGQELLVSTSRGIASRFCPGEGTAMSRADDGGWTYELISTEGPVLVIELTADKALRRIAYDTMACAAIECAGLQFATAGEQGPRMLQLNGTLVQGKGAWASLQGSVELPSW